jgi:hypothetical protein
MLISILIPVIFRYVYRGMTSWQLHWTALFSAFCAESFLTFLTPNFWWLRHITHSTENGELDMMLISCKRKTLVVIGTDCIGIIAIILRFFSLDLGTDLTAGFVFYLIWHQTSDGLDILHIPQKMENLTWCWYPVIYYWY